MRRRNKLTPAVLLLMLLVPASVFADGIDDIVSTFMAERRIPGAAVAVIRKGKIEKIKGYGLASLEFNVPVTTDTVFEIGSVSKQMTAAAIMLLVEDGKVSLDEKISAYLPNTPDAWKDVTVRHLLTHTSGIKSYSSLDGFALLRRLKAEDFIKQLSPHPLEFTPGERSIYSNSGFNLLAYIIEGRSGKPYIEFMRERIFRPLGMTKTTDRDPEYIIPNRAAGYEWRENRYAGRNWDLTDLMGAGSIVSTIGDMVKWNAGLDSNTFLKPSSKAEIWKQFSFNGGGPSLYGFGWRISETRGHRLVGHTGQTAGFTSANYRYPDHGLTIVVLTNTGETGNAGLLAGRLAKLFVPSMSIAAMKEIKADGVRSLKVQSALQSLIAGSPNEEVLTAELAKSFANPRLRSVYQRISQRGPIGKVELVGTNSVNGKTEELYRAGQGKRLYLWRVRTNDSGKLDLLSLEEEE